MIAFDLLRNRGEDAVDPAATQAVLRRANARGLILLGCGAQGEALRPLFPLPISYAVLDACMALLEQSRAPDGAACGAGRRRWLAATLPRRCTLDSAPDNPTSRNGPTPPPPS